ncbi:hypothetical protein IAE39_001810 [Pseudomonas sp. S37]|uniref:DUF6708 domain-containing protein n=1 Tax=Pseudomonas sp. S37 TaxID=2767449 RepID=UPI00191453FE|nr:DUF6708 domain-containing protein [Pseudomonas sp. S37]MBK4993636.1 hypothetical protein [Pseudomonas sp. S37]
MNTKRIPRNFLFGSTKLYHGLHQDLPPKPDGVRRINTKCIELETYGNHVQGGSAGFIGVSILISGIMSIVYAIIYWPDREMLIAILVWSPALTCFAIVFYFANGAHRCRGTFIRINRLTRKVYYIFPKTPQTMHVIDWDQIEGFAGFIPIVTSHGYTSRHPLYLLGIDYSMSPPTEMCIACGNLGVIDGNRSARTLWAYLQHFMAHGPEDLPPPPSLTAKLSRREAAIQPYREWLQDFKKELCEPYGWLWALVTVPIRLTLFFLLACLNSSEALIQYNVPYATFPHSNDVLCGFAEKRKPIIRLNGIKLDNQ